MGNTIENAEGILSQNISGFHRYILTDPVHLSYVSRNLCGMTGFREEELLSESEDMYAWLVHPADRAEYFEWIHKLQTGEQTLTLQYRLVKKDGSVIQVSDTVVSGKDQNGILTGDSVLTDITELKKGNDTLQFLNETIPCGFLKYTCEKQPRITYMNQQMLDMLRFPQVQEGEIDYLDLYRENIFLLIPMEERRKFAMYLNRVYTASAPMAGEISLLRCDGTRVYVFGWVTKCINDQGVEEFQSVCMDVTQRQNSRKEQELKRYIKALSEVYDKIFEYDLANKTVKCLCGQNSSRFKWIENIPMQMEEATEKWISDTVAEEDRDKVRAFFRDFCLQKLEKPGEKPPQVAYRAVTSRGERKPYSGIFLKMDNFVSLYCCRCVPDAEEADALRSENVSLKENLQKLVMRFQDGIAAFEVADQRITPLYASDNVCEFFGYTKEEWLPLMRKSTPIQEFIARSEITGEEVAELLQSGEAEFTYYDLSKECERRIKAVCSQKDTGDSSPWYIMLYNVEEEQKRQEQEAAGGPVVSIRTFGYFDVFVDGRPIAFRNKKSKELFALLVDRRGGFVSSQEAISFLWEEEPVNSVTLARYRKVALRLKNILEESGISHIVESVDGNRRIVVERVQCDLYDYLSGREEFSQLFKGNYLTNYSWGETTLAELTGEML